MKKVILTKGLPGSGKSTWAKSLLDKNPGKYKRVNKDDLRAMIDNSKWSKDNEKFILNIRDQIILSALENGKHIIVDDTNLHEKHINHIKELVKGKAEVEIKDFTDVTLETCIKQDLKRFNSVGKDVIVDMYNQFLKPEIKQVEFDPNLPKCIICDIDGTIAKMVNRSPFDWNKVDQDEVYQDIVDILKTYENKVDIIMMSGRDGSCKDLTMKWLIKNKIPFDNLLMRSANDMRKDSIVKQELYENYIKDQWNVLFVLDDRQQVVNKWRELGLRCLQVQEGNF